MAGAAFGVATLAGPVFAAADGKKTFTILHTNDMHSAFIGLGPASDYTPFKPDDDETGACRSQAVQPLNKGPKLKIKKPDRTRVPEWCREPGEPMPPDSIDVVRFRPTSTPTEPTITLQPLPLGLKHRFHAMVKPVGSMCNLDCTYCYYLHKQDLLQQPRQPRMAEEMLERHIRQYIEAQTGDEVVFSWQGGEPTILGLEFFRKVVSLQERHRKRGQRIENDLQTNGTLLDEEWAAFLKQSNFLVGLSCDGPKELHDRYRYTKGGTDTHAKVVEAARLLQKHDVPFAALCVVNRHNAKHPLEVYRFLTRELGAWRVQLISCVEPKVFHNVAPQRWDPTQLPVVGTARAKPGEADSVVTDWSVDPDDWGSFLCAVWDDWYANDFGRVHVDLFETAVAQSMGLPAQRCINAEFCGKGLAVEHNGDVFSCDHYVYPEYRLGNIAETHLGTMAYSEPQKKFGFAKRDTLPMYCKQCPHLKLCWGECPKNRLVRTPSGEAGLNYLCPGLKRFYAHIGRDMPRILKRIAPQ